MPAPTLSDRVFQIGLHASICSVVSIVDRGSSRPMPSFLHHGFRHEARDDAEVLAPLDKPAI